MARDHSRPRDDSPGETSQWRILYDSSLSSSYILFYIPSGLNSSYGSFDVNNSSSSSLKSEIPGSSPFFGISLSTVLFHASVTPAEGDVSSWSQVTVYRDKCPTKGSDEDKRGLASPDVLENDRSLDLGLTSARFHTLPTLDRPRNGSRGQRVHLRWWAWNICPMTDTAWLIIIISSFYIPWYGFVVQQYIVSGKIIWFPRISPFRFCLLLRRCRRPQNGCPKAYVCPKLQFLYRHILKWKNYR